MDNKSYRLLSKMAKTVSDKPGVAINGAPSFWA